MALDRDRPSKPHLHHRLYRDRYGRWYCQFYQAPAAFTYAWAGSTPQQAYARGKRSILVTPGAFK